MADELALTNCIKHSKLITLPNLYFFHNFYVGSFLFFHVFALIVRHAVLFGHVTGVEFCEAEFHVVISWNLFCCRSVPMDG